MTGSVPPLDLTDPEVIRDPYPHLAALREHAPFVRHEELQAHVASGHAEVSAALRHRGLGRIFRPREPEEDWETFNWLHADSILDSEPPKHTRLRRLVAGAFGRGHVARLEPRIRAIAEELGAQEETILAELNGVQGSPVDLGGYYAPELEKVTSVMRPSATLNAIVDKLSV